MRAVGKAGSGSHCSLLVRVAQVHKECLSIVF